MAGKKGSFTNISVQTIKLGKNGKLDGIKVDPQCPGLTLSVRFNGKMRNYLYRYMIDGKSQSLTLGSVWEHDPTFITLDDVRALVTKARALVKRGIDPATDREIQQRHPTKAKVKANAQATATPPDDETKIERHLRLLMEAKNAEPGTFAHDTNLFYENKHRSWDKVYAGMWWSSMVTHALPTLGSMETGKLTRQVIKAAIEPYFKNKPLPALKVIARIGQVIDHVIDTDPDRVQANVAARVAKMLPEGVVPPERHHPRLPWKQVPHFYSTRLGLIDEPWVYALRFMLLTATPRTEEIIGARWVEIDWEEKLWRVPGEQIGKPARYKSGKKLHLTTPRLVPLTDAAIAFLKALPSKGKHDLLFPGTFHRMLPGDGLLKPLQRLGLTDPENGRLIHVHGFRRTFKQWVRAHHRDMIDAADICLDHVVGNQVQRVYDDPIDLENRRILTDLWCGFVLSAIDLPLAA